MAEITGGSLGEARLDLTANLTDFERNVKAAEKTSGGIRDSLEGVAAIAQVAERELNRVKMGAAQGAESKASAEGIISGVRGISEEARVAAAELDKVRITDRQAAESDVAGDVIDRKLKDITGNANEARRSLESVKLASATSGGGPSMIGGTNIGFLGAALGGGALLAPTVGSAGVGLLASIPVLASSAAGALGVLKLAFDGVGAAIGGNKKAFDDLGPSAQQFVLTVRSLDGWFDKLKETAATNLFPGLTAALHSALSPGTVNAVTTAIAEFGKAIGQAAAQWGKYFGSTEFQSIFGPLMAAGARNLQTMSAAALSLFDAVGVLARAAIPLTTWLVDSAAAGARWVDTFLHAKDASGQLAGVLSQSQTSLRLVGGLFESLLKVVGELGAALLPVSQVAVKDLTSGLNALAGWIGRNQTAIRELVGGALNALVVGIKTAAQGIHAFYTSMKQDLGSNGAKAVVIALGAAIAVAFGPTSVAIAGALIAVGEIKTHWQTLKDWFTKFGLWMIVFGDNLALAIVDPFSHLPGVLGGWARNAKNAITSELDGARAALATIGENSGTAYGQGLTAGIAAALSKAGAAMAGPSGSMYSKKNGGSGQSPYDSGTMLPGQSLPNPNSGKHFTEAQMAALLVNAGASPQLAGILAHVAYMGESGGNAGAVSGTNSNGTRDYGLFQINSAHGYSSADMLNPQKNAAEALAIYNAQGFGAWTEAYGRAAAAQYGNWLAGTGGSNTDLFGTPPPWPTNTGSTGSTGQTAKQKAAAAAAALAQRLQVPVTNAQTLVAHYKALAAQADTGGVIAKYLDDEAAALKKENVALVASMRGKSAAQKAKIAGTIQKNEDTIVGLHKSIADAVDMSKEAVVFAAFKSKLAASATKLKADSSLAAVLTGSALDDENKTILDDEQARATLLQTEKSKLAGELRSAHGKFAAQLRTQLGSVTSQLTQIQDQVLSSLQGVVQTMQSRVATVFGAVQSEMLAQLGTEYFQNGLQTPLEKQLAQMQAADTASSLQDALTQAQATGDTAQIAQAQRAIDENNLAIAAAAERAKADQTYAQKSQELATKLATLADAFQNGAGSMNDLTTLAAAYGIQIDTGTIPDFANLSDASNSLITAFSDLAAYIGKITGVTPKLPSAAAGTAGNGPSAGFLLRAGIGSGGALSQVFGLSSGALLRAGIGSGGAIPSLDVGGEVLQTGLAKVHRGEIWSGVHGEAFGSGRPSGDIVLVADSREIARAAADGMARNPHANRVLAKAQKPALDRVVSVSK